MKKREAKTGSPISKRILFIGDFAYSSTKPIVSGVIRALSGRPDVALLIHGAHPGDDDYAYSIDPDVDGVITCIGTYKGRIRKLVGSKKRPPFAFVCAPCDMPSLRRRSVSLVCDDAAIAEAAASLLVRHGMTEFGYVGSRRSARWVKWDANRREAFQRALAARGFSASVYGPPKTKADSAAELAELAAWLRSLPKPCGLFVSYDQRAMRVLNICRAEGIAVPEQIQIVGVDNEEWICESTSPTLTSIEPDFEGAGHRAAEALLALIEPNEKLKMKNEQFAASGLRPSTGGTAATLTFGVRRVVQRMSTTDAHGSMNRAVRARDHIRTHAGEPETVAQIAKKLCCSVRTLQTSYRAVFGTTVWEDMAEARLEKAKKLLADTKTPVGEIPELVGFESPPHFMRFFKRRTGMSMRAWRRANGIPLHG